MRTCSECKLEKNDLEFPLKDAKGHYKCLCKLCKRDYDKNWFNALPVERKLKIKKRAHLILFKYNKKE